MPGFSVCAYDLEMADLKANYGILLCGVVYNLDTGEISYHRLDESKNYKKEPWNDRELAVSIRDKLSEFDIMVGYNSVMFDVKFLNTRLLYHKEKLLPGRPTLRHIDLLFRVKNHLLLHSSSLDSLATFLEFDHQKTRISGGLWSRAMAGDRTALDYIVEHCRLDVLVLVDAWPYLKQFVREIR